jgi:hypothetical protein
VNKDRARMWKLIHLVLGEQDIHRHLIKRIGLVDAKSTVDKRMVARWAISKLLSGLSNSAIPKFKFFGQLQIHRWSLAGILYLDGKCSSWPDCGDWRRRDIDWYKPRSNSRDVGIRAYLSLIDCASSETALPDAYDGDDASKTNRSAFIIAGFTAFSLLFFLIATVLSKYAFWNLYDGPCDWRSVPCLVLAVISIGFLSQVFPA